MTAKPATTAATKPKPIGKKGRKVKRKPRVSTRKQWGLRRRRFLVNRLAQIRFTFKLLVQVGLFYLVLGLLVQRHVVGLLALLKDIPASSEALMTALTTDIVAMKQQFYIVGVLLSVLATLGVGVIGVLSSHRLIGPILRLKRFLVEPLVGNGGEPIRFRRRDHLDSLAEELNQMRTVVTARRAEIAGILDQLAAQARDLTRSETPESAQELFEAMDENLRQLTALMESATPVDGALDPAPE